MARPTTPPPAPPPSTRLLRAAAAEREQLERHRSQLLGTRESLRAELDRIEDGLREVEERHRLLDRLAPGAKLDRFVPHDPDRAGCEIVIEGLVPAPG